MAAVAALAACVAAGCSEGDFGESLLEPRQSAAGATEASVPAEGLHVPQDAPLTVADSSRYSTGDARADGSADKSGVAHAGATLSGVGDGWAEFTLGHMLPAGRPAARDVVATFSVDYTCELQVPEGAAAAAGLAGQVTLKVTVLDSHRRIVRRQVLTDRSDDDGAVRWSGGEQVEFDLTLAPDRAYHFIIAGRTQLARESTAGESDPSDAAASATLRVVSSSIDIARRQ